jgi:hypothetical protein
MLLQRADIVIRLEAPQQSSKRAQVAAMRIGSVVTTFFFDRVLRWGYFGLLPGLGPRRFG